MKPSTWEEVVHNLHTQIFELKKRVDNLESALKYIAWAGPELGKGEMLNIAQEALKT